MEKTVGKFRYVDGDVEGPADYMQEKGNARIERILAGQDTVFNAGLQYSPDPVTALLVSLQTDYAGYVGMRELEIISARAKL